jgi:hypothetical protein
VSDSKDTAGRDKSGRQPDGRFGLGNRANPAGRPKGARNKSTLAAEALLDGEAAALSRMAIQLAMAGDTTALRLCLERVLPPRKDRLVEMELPRITSAEEAAGAMTTLIEKVAEGELSPAEAESIASLVERRAKIAEAHEFELRLRALEQRT